MVGYYRTHEFILTQLNLWIGVLSKMEETNVTDEELADKKIKEMFPLGFCVSGNYEGYKRAIFEGIKIGRNIGVKNE